MQSPACSAILHRLETLQHFGRTVLRAIFVSRLLMLHLVVSFLLKMETKTSGGVNRCAAKFCINNSKTSHCSFFKFPSENKRARVWAIACNREDLIDKDNLHNLSYKLCAMHFENRMFSNVAHNRLRKDAIPHIFPTREGTATGSREEPSQGWRSVPRLKNSAVPSQNLPTSTLEYLLTKKKAAADSQQYERLWIKRPLREADLMCSDHGESYYPMSESNSSEHPTEDAKTKYRDIGVQVTEEELKHGTGPPAGFHTSGNVEDVDSKVDTEDELLKTAAIDSLNPSSPIMIKNMWQGDELEKRMDEAYNILQSSVQQSKTKKDELDIYGQLITAKFRKMDEETRYLAMNKIDNILFELKRNHPFQNRSS